MSPSRRVGRRLIVISASSVAAIGILAMLVFNGMLWPARLFAASYPVRGIDTVPKGATLPIALDLEYYGDFFAHPPTRENVDAILEPLLRLLEEHYGAPPVIYATSSAYDRYLSGGYADNPIWIRSIVLPPTLDDGRNWTIWQYSDHDRLKGYAGVEQYIDMNVFHGTRDELAALAG